MFTQLHIIKTTMITISHTIQIITMTTIGHIKTITVSKNNFLASYAVSAQFVFLRYAVTVYVVQILNQRKYMKNVLIPNQNPVPVQAQVIVQRKKSTLKTQYLVKWVKINSQTRRWQHKVSK